MDKSKKRSRISTYSKKLSIVNELIASVNEPKIKTQNTMSNTQQKKKFDFCKIKVCLSDDKFIIQYFKATRTLSEVKSWIQKNRTDGKNPFFLFHRFTRKLFKEKDLMLTLSELNLCPDCTLLIKEDNDNENIEFQQSKYFLCADNAPKIIGCELIELKASSNEYFEIFSDFKAKMFQAKFQIIKVIK